MEHDDPGRGPALPDAAARAIAELSRQLAHPLRVVVLKRVSEHGPCAFSELVEVAGAPQAQVSNHLSVLRKAGLLATERRGRQSLYRLPNSHLAEVLADLQAAVELEGFGPAGTAPQRSEARGCYDHVGGRLGVVILRTLLERNALTGDPLGPEDLSAGPAAGAVSSEFGVPGRQRREGGTVLRGPIGPDAPRQDITRAATACALRALSALRHALGDLDAVERVLHPRGFINSRPDFEEHPAALDAPSSLLREVFGERGHHARSALGVASLPGGGLLEIELTAAVLPPRPAAG
jgi:DNA-binding transcriptional ArsR family regulator/enamine deaminase RidA (YjgF/YER057c/UK114 family)